VTSEVAAVTDARHAAYRLATHGDALEQACYRAFLSDRFPNYERFGNGSSYPSRNARLMRATIEEPRTRYG
jgi:hypothetical protein